VELDQPGGLYAPLSLKRLLEPGEMVQLPLAVAPSTGAQGEGSAGGPALQPLAA